MYINFSFVANSSVSIMQPNRTIPPICPTHIIRPFEGAVGLMRLEYPIVAYEINGSIRSLNWRATRERSNRIGPLDSWREIESADRCPPRMPRVVPKHRPVRCAACVPRHATDDERKRLRPARHVIRVYCYRVSSGSRTIQLHALGGIQSVR